MSTSNQSTITVGPSLPSLLFILFLGLKLTETGPVADWSWWWVTSPLWIPLAILASIVAVFVMIWGVARFLGKKPRITVSRRG